MRIIFAYDDYSRNNLIGPLLIIIFFGIIGIENIKSFPLVIKNIFEAIKSKEKYAVGDVIEEYFLNIFLMLVCVFFIFINTSILLNGGIYLITERETDAVYTQGVIQSIEQLPQYSAPKYQTNYGTSFGVKVNINGNNYNIITTEEFEIGTNVTIKYLPKSKFVLEMYENEKSSE